MVFGLGGIPSKGVGSLPFISGTPFCRVGERAVLFSLLPFLSSSLDLGLPTRSPVAGRVLGDGDGQAGHSQGSAHGVSTCGGGREGSRAGRRAGTVATAALGWAGPAELGGTSPSWRGVWAAPQSGHRGPCLWLPSEAARLDPFPSATSAQTPWSVQGPKPGEEKITRRQLPSGPQGDAHAGEAGAVAARRSSELMSFPSRAPGPVRPDR